MPSLNEGMTSDEYMTKLNTCESSGECLQVASEFGEYIRSKNMIILQSDDIISKLMAAATNKKSGLEREGGLLGFAGLAKIVGISILPYLLPLIPKLMESQADKGVAVREAGHLAVKNILGAVDKHGIVIAMPYLIDCMMKGKWQSKLAALEFLTEWGKQYPVEIGDLLPDIIPGVPRIQRNDSAVHQNVGQNCRDK